jgi:hypothetical protein
MRMNLLAAALLVCHGIAQTIPYETGYKFGRLIPLANRWEGPLALDLLRMAGTRTGKVWLRQTPDGILIFSRISGSSPHYARSPNEINASDRVGVWLSTVRDVDMPEIGWGHQGGLTNCKEIQESDPAGACQLWQARQVKYRELLRRLFIRHWELTPTVSLETYASNAYRDALAYAANDELMNLEPRGTPSMQVSHGTGFSYFEVFIPWSDFPPVNALELSRIYIAVDFCGPGDACSSTAPERVDGDPTTFNRLDLALLRISRITPCSYPLQAADFFENAYPAWYFMDATGRPTEIFSLQNRPFAYQSRPESLSPVPEWTHYFSKTINTSEVVCGPFLRYAAGKRTYGYGQIIDGSHLAVRSVPGGHLIKSGPTSGQYRPFGNGECGSCGTVTVDIYHVSPETGIAVAFAGYRTVEAGKEWDGDIRVSPDWTTATIYTSETSDDGKEVWSSERYCLAGVKYKECGEGPAGAPPGAPPP